MQLYMFAWAQRGGGVPKMILAMLGLAAGLVLSCFRIALPQNQPEHLVAAAPTAYSAKISQLKVIPDNAGGFFALFKSKRGQPGYANLYLQHIQKGGDKRLSTHGLPIHPADANQSHPALAHEAGEGLYIAWQALGPQASTTQVFVQRYDRFAQPTLAPQPLAVSNREGPQQAPVLLPDRAGGVFVFWQGSRQGSEQMELFGQHINAAGEREWGPGGKLICSTPAHRKQLSVRRSPSQAALLLWEEFHPDGGWHLRAQKVKPDGEAAWPAAGVPVRDRRLQNLRNPRFFSDGFGGLVCVYEALGKATQGRDLYITRINRHGEVRYTQPICEAPGDQNNPQILAKGSKGIVYWQDERPNAPGTYAQQFDFSSGEHRWQAAGRRVLSDSNATGQVQVLSSSVYGRPILAWHSQSAQWEGLKLQKLKQGGQLAWDETRVVQRARAIPQYQIVGNEQGGAWVVWIQTDPGGGHKLCYQTFTSQGFPGFRELGCIARSRHQQAYAKIKNLALLRRPGGGAYLAWEDYRHGPGNPDIYAQKLDANGQPQWQKNGVPVCVHEGHQGAPKLFLHQGEPVIGWSDRRNGEDDDLYIQRLRPDGHKRWPWNGKVLCNARKLQSNLRFTRDEQGHLFAIWTDSRHFLDTGFDLFMQRLDSTGKGLWGTNGRPMCRTRGYQTAVSIAPAQTGGFFAAWMDDRGEAYQIYLQRVSAEGALQYERTGLKITHGTEHQRFPLLRRNDVGEVVMLWTDERYGRKHSKLYATSFDPMQGFQGPTGGFRMSSTPGRQTQPQINLLPDRDLLISWLDQRNEAENGYELYCQRLKWPNYKPVWQAYGVKLGEYLQENNPYTSLVRKGSAYFAWTQQVEADQPKLFWCTVDLQTGESYRHRVVNTRAVPQWRPRLFPGTDGRLGIAWREAPSEKVSRIYSKVIEAPNEP